MKVDYERYTLSCLDFWGIENQLTSTYETKALHEDWMGEKMGEKEGLRFNFHKVSWTEAESEGLLVVQCREENKQTLTLTNII